MKLFGNRSKKEKNNNIPIEENKQFFSCEDMEFKDFHEENITKFITSKEEFLSKADINSKDFKYIVLACFKVVCEKSKISISSQFTFRKYRIIRYEPYYIYKKVHFR
jgi:hypothetical protein